MTGEEFMFLSKTASQNDKEKNPDTPSQSTSEKKYVYGIDGIAEIFGCSRPTASRIKKSGRINAAIRQIERKTAEGKPHIPNNADETRTHLNRELIAFPDGVQNRTQAIQHRIETAGLQRKVGKNQTRAIRVLLTGTHEQMMKLAGEGPLMTGTGPISNGCMIPSARIILCHVCSTWMRRHPTFMQRLSLL